MSTHSLSGEAQKCFINSDGYMLCNFVVRKGREIRSKSGKMLKFFVGIRYLKKKSLREEEAVLSKPTA